MLEQTSSVLPPTSLIKLNGMGIIPGHYAAITEANLPATGTTGTPEKSLESGLDEAQQRILATYTKIGKFDLKKLKVEMLPSGIKVLDSNNFFTKDQARLITVGAHTSHGKTALMMQLAAFVSIEHPVIVHSFEMSDDQLERRLLAAIAGVPTGAIMEGSLAHKKVQEAREDYAKRKLYVSKIQNRSLNYVMSSVFELSKIIGRPGLVVIDYGQQVRPGGGLGANQTRVNEITDISAGLLQLAQQLNCNVMVGAQLNNEVLKRAYGSKDEEGNMEYLPIISDIREGSSIAHDSDTVLMVVRPHVFNRKASKDVAQFYCVKNREGELWEENLKWDGSKCLFYEGSHGL